MGIGSIVTTEAGDKITRTRVYRHGRLEQEDFPVAKVSDYLNEPDTVVWVDLCAPDAAGLDLVATELGLHALAIEDAVQPRQRPKLDRYATHEFLNIYAARLDHATGALMLSEVAAFITPAALVTVRKDTSSPDGTSRPTSPSTGSDSCSTG